jgi:hypothetical protein
MSQAGRYRSEGDRLIAETDALMEENPTQDMNRVVSRCTNFLKTLPLHPSLDGIRIRIHQKRAEAYRIMGKTEPAARDERMAEEIRKRWVPGISE